jgi:hypothetical protein
MQERLKAAASEGPAAFDAGSFSEVLPILAALDRLGCHDGVREMLYSYSALQRLSGEMRLVEERDGDTGCAIWSLVDHARLTGDTAYLKAVYRLVRRGLRWIRRHRSADGAEAHAGLIRSASGRAAGGFTTDYPVSFRSLAGIQEAARAAATLGRRGHLHDGESLYHELKRAVQKSLDHTAREQQRKGMPLEPGGEMDERAVDCLTATVMGDVFSTENAHLSDTVSFLHERQDNLSARDLAVVAQHLLRRGDGRVWEVTDRLLEQWSGQIAESNGGSSPALGFADVAQLAWLLRDLHVSDQHALLLLAPAYALRPLDDGQAVEIDRAPTRYGPISYRLERQGSELVLAWAPLVRPAPDHLIWPLPGRAHRIEPPRSVLTDSRMAIRLQPEGGQYRVQLVGDILG